MKLSKLLLVEDNLEAAHLITYILEYVGHTIVHKSTAIEGLQAAQTEYFDGMLIDYMLPDMDGLQLCHTIREFAPNVPILLVSAYVHKLTPEMLVDAGVTGFVPKPISQNIIHIINQYIKTRSMEMVELKEPENWVKRVLGPYYAD